MKANTDIRAAIQRAGLKHYEVATLLGISQFTFSHWLQLELPEAKKAEVLTAITTNGAEHEQEKENT